MTLPAGSPQATSLDSYGPPQAKASLEKPRYRQVTADAIKDFYGSLKAAAIELKVDASQLLREWERGMFLRFDEHASDDAKAYVAERVNAVFGRLHDPKLRARQLLADIDARLNELRGCLESML